MTQGIDGETRGEGGDVRTSPGLGPQVGIDSLRRHSDNARCIELGEEERAALDLMQSQIQRYEWFAERLDGGRDVEESLAVLSEAPSRPGQWEEALVALSLTGSVLARAVLEQWEPPSEDGEMQLFYQICLLRTR